MLCLRFWALYRKGDTQEAAILDHFANAENDNISDLLSALYLTLNISEYIPEESILEA